jgi:tRNA(fMet)-specific endonuclease VapC
MPYLLDTCIVSYFFRKEEGVLSKIQSFHPEDLKISSITFMEIQYGFALNPAIKKKIGHVWESFIEQIEMLDFNSEDAQYTADLRKYLKEAGTPIGAYDLLLAGTALSRGLIFVTDNTKEFSRVPKLTIENWCQAIS